MTAALSRVDADLGQRMRYPELAAHLQHPGKEAVEAALGQIQHAGDDFRLLGDGMAVVES